MKKTICDKCSREVSNSGFNRHYSACTGVYFTGPNKPKPKKGRQPKSQAWYDSMEARRGTATNQFTVAKANGTEYVVSPETRRKLRDANLGKSHTADTKLKISKARIKYLHANPDKVPYKLNHYAKGRSYPEVYWKIVLDNLRLSYVEQYQVGPYQLDFAFIADMVDLEIDGDQHYLDPKIIASDIRRDEYLAARGWRTVRVKWSEYQKMVDREKYIDYIKDSITKGA